MFEEMHQQFHEITKEALRQLIVLEDRRVLDALIGSRILDFQLNKIPNRKTMYELYIKTDAPNVPHLEFNFDSNRLEIVEQTNVFIIPSEIKLRVKL